MLESRMRGVGVRVTRWLPFVTMAIVSLWVAAGVPGPRRPFSVDLGITTDALAHSLGKLKHYESTSLFFLLGVVAVGWRRAAVPFLLAMGMGVAWELAEATALRHTARLADLAPDLAGAVGCVALCVLCRSLARRWVARTEAQRG
jgi:hypothetical protein